MKVRFDTPEHGWMLVELASAGGTQRCDVSDLPVDPIAELVRVLVRVASGSAEEELIWFLEPDEWSWTFRRVGEDLELVARTPALEELSVRVPTDEMLRIMCRALLRLGGDPAWARTGADRSVWSWEFPTRELDILRGQVLGP